MMLLPPSLEEMMPENHPVRVVNRFIDAIDMQYPDHNEPEDFEQIDAGYGSLLFY